jgi:hypothetical protein
MCEEIWESWGGTVERHAADWDRFGKAGGFIRNEEMVNLGADKCLSFNKGKSRGTAHTTLLARQAGIDTIEYVA